MVAWLLGDKGRQLNVTQFVLEDGCVFRTWEAHERLIEVCQQLGDEALAKQVFGENHAASIKSYTFSSCICKTLSLIGFKKMP